MKKYIIVDVSPAPYVESYNLVNIEDKDDFIFCSENGYWDKKQVGDIINENEIDVKRDKYNENYAYYLINNK